jgi:hypothetical protein
MNPTSVALCVMSSQLIVEPPPNSTFFIATGWDHANGFEIRNIPPEWRKLFKDAGVTKNELRNGKPPSPRFAGGDA